MESLLLSFCLFSDFIRRRIHGVFEELKEIRNVEKTNRVTNILNAYIGLL